MSRVEIKVYLDLDNEFEKSQLASIAATLTGSMAVAPANEPVAKEVVEPEKQDEEPKKSASRRSSKPASKPAEKEPEAATSNDDEEEAAPRGKSELTDKDVSEAVRSCLTKHKAVSPAACRSAKDSMMEKIASYKIGDGFLEAFMNGSTAEQKAEFIAFAAEIDITD